jgi:Fe-S cluster assembly protein SufD
MLKEYQKKQIINHPIISTDFELTENFSDDFQESEYLTNFRKNAWHQYQTMSFPLIKDEAWRRVNLDSLDISKLKLGGNSKTEISLPDFDKKIYSAQSVFCSGQKQIYLEDAVADSGVLLMTISDASRQYPEILKKILGQILPTDKDKFVSLSSALFEAGVLLYVPSGVKIEKPVRNIFISSDNQPVFLTRLLVFMEDASEVTFVQSFQSDSPSMNQALHIGVIEAVIEGTAKFNFVEIQDFGKNIWHISHEKIKVAESAEVNWFYAGLGSHFTKSFLELDLSGRRSAGKMKGIYFTDSDQFMDLDTRQNHLASNTTSDLLFKGILDDQSQSVWQGMIYVAPDTVNADGYQANRNLVLSSEAKTVSIPGLEILADEVRCTHGATVSEIDRDQIFYLTSRGIPRTEAEKLIVGGFIDEVLSEISHPEVKSAIQSKLLEKIDKAQL